MGLFSSLFGSKPSTEDQRELARKLLNEAAQLSEQGSPGKALKLLAAKARALYPVLGLEGELHPAFAELACRLRAAETSGQVSPASVRLLPWSTWPEPTIGDVIAAAANQNEDVLYCRASSEGRGLDALAEVDALAEFRHKPQVAMIVIGDEHMMFRRSFLTDVARDADPNSEDVGQDLADQAEHSGLQVHFY